MKLQGEQILLRVYLRNTDSCGWFPTVDTLVRRAQAEKLAGATVLRGTFGLDSAGRLLGESSWSLVEHVPVIVEFVDTAQAIGRFLSVLEEVVVDGLATLERAHVLVYRQTRETATRAFMPLEPPASITPLSTLPTPPEFPAMKASETGQLLRIFLGSSDVWHEQPLYRAIVLKARDLGLAGATVLEGPMGFGAHSRMHTVKLLELSSDLPVIVEIVDSAAKIQSLLPFLDEAVTEGLITIEDVRILKYRHRSSESTG